MQVFLSYASTERDTLLVRALAAALRGAKLSPWLDEERLPPGQRLEADLRLAIERSEAGVFLVSGSWLESKWCRWELAQFGERKPPPLLIALLRQPRDQIARLLGPDLSALTQLEWADDTGAVEERFWRLYCGLTQSPPGPQPEWAARGSAIARGAFSAAKQTLASDSPPIRGAGGPYALISITCDRTKHWGTIVTHASLNRHEVLALMGPRGFGHKQLLMRIAQELTDPPRVVKEVSWGDRRPDTQPDLLELLLQALSERPAAGDLETRAGEQLRTLLSTRNVVLLHPPVRSGFDRSALVDYYTSTLPRLLGAAPWSHQLKCVQPVEWLPKTTVRRLRNGLADALGPFTDPEDDSSETAARGFINRLKTGATPTFPLTILPVLDDVPQDELAEFLDRQDLTEAQRARLLKRVLSVATTPDEIFKAIDDYYPEVRGSTP